MSETELCTPYLARIRFSCPNEAELRRPQPGASSRNVTSWCVRTLREIIPAGKILDLACGNGRHLPELTVPTIQVFGGDLSTPMLEKARCIGGNEPLACFEAEKLPFKDDTFEGIFSARFFHHIPSVEIRSQILAEMFRISKLAVVITYKAEFSGEHFRHLAKCAIRTSKPVRYFNRLEEFQSIAEVHGWSVTDIFNTGKILSSNRGLLFEPR